MTPQKLASKMMMQVAILAVFYVTVLLLAAVKFLPDDELVHALSYRQVVGWSHVLLELAMLTSLIGAAIHSTVEAESRPLTWTFRGWTLFLIAAFFAGALDMLEGRHLLELPPLLDAVLIVLLIAFMVVVIQANSDEAGQGKFVWLVGMGFVLSAFLVSLLPVSSILVDRVLRVFSVNMRFNVGYLLAGLAVVYWWPRQMNLYVIAGIAGVLGTLVSFIPLSAIGQTKLAGWLLVAVMIVCWIFLLREFMKPGIAPQPWVSLGIAAWVISLGLLGSPMSLPSVAAFVQGTQLSVLQLTLIAWGVLIIVLGFHHQIPAHAAPSPAFWLIAIGLLGGYTAFLIAAGAQTIMERVLSMGYLTVQSALVPLYVVWIVGLLVMGVGLVWLLIRTRLHEE